MTKEKTMSENVNIEAMEAAWRHHNDTAPVVPMNSFDFFAAGYKAQSERIAKLEAALREARISISNARVIFDLLTRMDAREVAEYAKRGEEEMKAALEGK